MGPLVSVVIPTRNRRDLLELTIESVLGQIGVDLEVVVVDEASDDGTSEWLASHHDPRVRRVPHDRPLGVATSRNDGIAASRGMWVALLDDDDLWAPWKLRVQLAAAGTADAAWACSGAVAVSPDLRVVDVYRPLPGAEVQRRLPRENAVPVGSSNVLVLRKALEQAGPVDASFRHLADWDLWRRLAEIGPPAVVDSPDVAYRLHSGNASLGVAGIIEEALLLERRSDLPIDWGVIHSWIAVNHLRAGARLRGAAAYARAGRHGNPRHLLRAVNALLTPGAGRRHTFHPIRRNGADRDVEWRHRAEAWLETLR